MAAMIAIKFGLCGSLIDPLKCFFLKLQLAGGECTSKRKGFKISFSVTINKLLVQCLFYLKYIKCIFRNCYECF